ncbi:MAG: flavodoxin domain-containing protein [Marinilabiliaceae bacterium]
MKTAIVYTTRHGTTEKVAQMIKEGLHEEAELINLKKSKKPDLKPFEKIIIGSSIHTGKIPKKLYKFLENNLDTILEKPVGLFLCCMYEKEAWAQFEEAFPATLRKHARSSKCVGGELLLENMNFLEKAMIKKITGTDSSQSKIDQQQIRELIKDMQST